MTKLFTAIVLASCVVIGGCAAKAPLFDPYQHMELSDVYSTIHDIQPNCGKRATEETYDKFTRLNHQINTLITYTTYFPNGETQAITFEKISSLMQRWEKNFNDPVLCKEESKLIQSSIEAALTLDKKKER